MVAIFWIAWKPRTERFINCDCALIADILHRLGEKMPDLMVAVRRGI